MWKSICCLVFVPLHFTAASAAPQSAAETPYEPTERYATKEEYLFRVTECVLGLKQDRLLLDEDVTILLADALRQSAMLDRLRSGDIRPVEDVAIAEGAEAAFAYFQELDDAAALWWFGQSRGRFMNTMNGKGYELMAEGRLDAALEVFKLNTMIFPENGNVWDSLAECHYNKREFDLAIEYYRKSLEIDPQNANAVMMLERIEQE